MKAETGEADGFISGRALVDSTRCRIIELDSAGGPVGHIDKLLLSDGKLVVRDRDSRRLLVFDEKSGAFLYAVSHVGKASNEYLDITDYCATPRYIYVLDMHSQKILIYRSADGAYLRTINISRYWANSLFVLGDAIYLVNDGSDTSVGKYHLFKIDEEGKCMAKYLPFDTDYSLCAEQCLATLPESGEALYCLAPNKIYRIDKDGCDLYLQLDFGRWTLPTEYLGKDLRELAQSGVWDRYVLGVRNMKATGRFLLFEFSLGDQSYTLCYDRESGEVETGKGVLMDCAYQAGLSEYFAQEKGIYNVYDASEYLTLYKEILSKKTYSQPQCQDEQDALYRRTMPAANPILFYYPTK